MRYWAGLCRRFDEPGLDPRRCFFTNIGSGLRRGTKPSGPFPGRRAKNFTDFRDLQALR